MLDFFDDKLKFKYNGNEYEVNYPKVIDVKNFQKMLKDGGEEIECTINFICSLGAPKEVLENLRVWQLNSILESLIEEKSLKKN